MELTIGQLIKIVIGVVVIAVVIGGVYLFGQDFMSFFKNLPGEFLVLKWI